MLKRSAAAFALAAGVGLLALTAPSQAQTTLNGDHAVDGNLEVNDRLFVDKEAVIDISLCVGNSCAATETFTSDIVLRLKYTQIHTEFIDTSSESGAFPSNDWKLRVNDVFSGGLDRFSVEDLTGGTIPFTIEAGARDNALWVASNGYIGVGTMLPQQGLHLAHNVETGIRLDAGGDTPYVWDLRGNVAGLYVYDLQTSRIPFEIRANAPNGAVMVESNGFLGLGTRNPNAALNILRTDGEAKALIREANGTTSPRTLLELLNNGRPEIVMGNSSAGNEWSFGAGTNFILKTGAIGTDSADKTKHLTLFGATGNLEITGQIITGGGTCGGGCDRVFTERQVIDADEYAASMWAKGHLPHVGPTKEGAPINVSQKLGGMLNALEHAHIFIEEQRGKITQLNSEKAALEARVARLEALIAPQVEVQE